MPVRLLDWKIQHILFCSILFYLSTFSECKGVSRASGDRGRMGSRTKHPGTKHPMPFFYTPDKTSHKDLPPRTKHPTLFLSPRT